MKFEGKSYIGAEVHLDGNQYLRCKFDGCKLVYSGGYPPLLSECDIDKSAFEFTAAAARTLAFLKHCARPESGMQDVVAATFPELFMLRADFKDGG